MSCWLDTQFPRVEVKIFLVDTKQPATGTHKFGGRRTIERNSSLVKGRYFLIDAVYHYCWILFRFFLVGGCHEQTMIQPSSSSTTTTPQKSSSSSEESSSKLLPPDSPCESEVSTMTTESSKEAANGRIDKSLEDEDDKGPKRKKASIFFVGVPILNYTLAFALGVVGFLDICATILPSLVLLEEGQDENGASVVTNNDEPPSPSSSPEQDAASGTTYYLHFEVPKEFASFVAWLDYHNLAISFTFSALWFVKAFLRAAIARNRAVNRAERRRLVGGGQHDPEKTKKPTTRLWWRRPNFVYFRTVLFQLLLCPIGFYFILYLEVQRASRGEDIMEFDEHMGRDVVEIGSFSAPSKATAFTAVAQHLYFTLTGTSIRLAKSKAVAVAKSTAPRLLGNVIRRPRQFRRRLRKLMMVIRWIQYLGPLIGTCNKLKGNVADLMKKRRQQIMAEKQKRVRQHLFSKKAPKLQREQAATMIQSAYRAYYSRKATRAMKIFRCDQEHMAALKLQKQFLRKLAEARERLKKKKEELKRLEQISRKNVNRLSDEEKMRMYELQDEIRQQAKDLFNKKLLLRPNTKFAVIWKYLFCICVILEISGLAIKPWLKKGIKNKKTGKSMSVGQFIADNFVPTRASERPECQQFARELLKVESKRKRFCNGDCEVEQYKYRQEKIAELKEEQPWYCKEPLSSVQEGVRDFVALLLVPSEVSDWPECKANTEEKHGLGRIFHSDRKKKDEVPWYCVKPYTEMHAVYRNAVTFFVEEFLIFVSIVCFLDVFVTFFTGELHSENGALIPKPFFARWIMPGLMLQLMVNPNIATVSGYVWRTWSDLLKLGPARVLRWNVAVTFPVVYTCWRAFMKKIWLPFVQRENTQPKL